MLQVIGAPLAAGLLALDGCFGLAGWQWLFIVEVNLQHYMHLTCTQHCLNSPDV